MAVTEEAKAAAKVQTMDGVLHTYHDTMEAAGAFAKDANKRAEDMGVKARYEATTT